MCTDEQWTQRAPTHTIMISKFWINNPKATEYKRQPFQSFWLTPMDVPPGENSYKFSFPSFSGACQTHAPAKFR